MSELLPLPNVIFFGGKKKSGKDFICNVLREEHGFTVIHIADPWLRFTCRNMGIDYETEYLPNKHLYRAEIQRRAVAAREADPDCLIKMLPERIYGLLAEGHKVAVSGIRFINEALFAIWNGYLMVKVEVSDDIRRERFIDAGESLELFEDPFEREIDEMPYHLWVPGDLEAWRYPFLLSGGYIKLTLEARKAMKEAS